MCLCGYCHVTWMQFRKTEAICHRTNLRNFSPPNFFFFFTFSTKLVNQTLLIPLSSVFVLTSKEKERSLCVPDFPEPSDVYWQYVDLLTFILLYMLPLLIITASYTTVACRLGRHNAIGDTTTAQHAAQRRKRRRTLAMLLLVVGVFAICWFPLNCYVVLLSSHAIHSSNALYFCFHWLAMSSTCYNPFIYCCLNPTFRQELRLLLDFCWRKRRRPVVRLEPELRPVQACTPPHRVAWPDDNDSSRPRHTLSHCSPASQQSQAYSSHSHHIMRDTHVLFTTRPALNGRTNILSVEPIVTVSWLETSWLLLFEIHIPWFCHVPKGTRKLSDLRNV